jgi:tRNA(Met) cytidine acetyltransferase
MPNTSQRQLIIISDTPEVCFQMAKKMTVNIKTLWLSDDTIDAQTTLSMKKATTVLGQEYQAVVFNSHPNINKNIAFDANAFGAVVGTIVAGGYLLLLTPELSQWTDNSYFIQRFIALLKRTPTIFYTKDQSPLPLITPTALLPEINETLISEQQTVFNAMLRVRQGHRRRPLLLTSDRGRGKSTLLGKLAAYLLQQGCSNIIVTAPSRKIAETLLNAAMVTVENLDNRYELLKGLQFLAPDELHQQKPNADLILVDEAASLPLPMLGDFVKQHSRIIFATTEHGYEGNGRGFAIRFRSLLDKLCPQWKQAHLEQPFRWLINDPLEKFSFELLLLNAEIADLNDVCIHQLAGVAYQIERIEPRQLLANETLLGEIFGLFVNVHYQTKPSDLVRLLDDKQYQIFTLRYQTHLIATALMVREGGFSQPLAEEIYYGNRRPQGHLVPQLLATHAGIKEAPCYYADRIMRIAVHPKVQGCGIGSYLLKYLTRYSKQHNKVDYIATSFGATSELLSFWRKAGFQTVQIGIKRDASSGAHSIVMLQSFTQNGQYLQARAGDHFHTALPLLLADPLRYLEAPLVANLFKLFSQKKRLDLSRSEQDALVGFTEQQRGYENSIAIIYKLTLYCLSQSHQSLNLTPQELQILIAKVLQKHHWLSLAKLTNIKGKKQSMALLRQAVRKLVALIKPF